MNLASPDLPVFVLIRITPFAPRAPYWAVEAASFKTEILAMLFASMEERADMNDEDVLSLTLPLITGTPSIT